MLATQRRMPAAGPTTVPIATQFRWASSFTFLLGVRPELPLVRYLKEERRYKGEVNILFCLCQSCWPPASGSRSGAGRGGWATGSSSPRLQAWLRSCARSVTSAGSTRSSTSPGTTSGSATGSTSRSRTSSTATTLPGRTNLPAPSQALVGRGDPTRGLRDNNLIRADWFFF